MQSIVGPALRLLQFCASKPVLASSFHILSKPPPFAPLLAACQPTYVPNCGFKVKGRVRKRCKDCFMVRREERWYVLCKTHPRHKQMSMIKDPKNTWMLSHATQGYPRPW